MINSAISVILGFIIVCIIVALSQQKHIKRIMIRLFHKTLNNDIWRDVLDLKNGSNLKVYLKDNDYYIIGHYKNHEENGTDSWLALNAFAKYDKETNKKYKNEPSYLNDSNVIITVRFSDVEHIEIF